MSLELKRLAVNGLAMAYADIGDGDTIVFVHGAISDHRIWEPQLTGFEGPFRRIAFYAALVEHLERSKPAGPATTPDAGRQAAIS